MVGMALSAWTGTQATVFGLLVAVTLIIVGSLFPHRQNIMLGGVGIMALWLGIVWYAHAFERWHTLPETVEYTGLVEIIERGEVKVFYRPLTLRPISETWSGGDILYRAPIDMASQPGEHLDFQCALSRPKNFEPGFDYRLLLATRGTGYVCERGGEATALLDAGSRFRTALSRAQSEFRTRITALIPEPEAGLLMGLLIGGDDTLAPETKAAFGRAGLSHIVAVSGYNMSVVAQGLVILALVFGLWRRFAVGLAVIGLAGFLLFIDGSAASLRAAIMAWLAFGAYFVGRPAASWNGLLIAGASMLIFNPLLIRFDVGFQLSFLATLALLVFTRSFETFGCFRHWYGKIAAMFLTTVIIELFTLPVIGSTFGVVSLIAPIANVIVLPLVPFAMFVGIGMIMVSVFWPGLGFLLVPLVWLPLTAIVRTAEGLANIPWSSLDLSRVGLDIGATFALLWYAGLGIGVYQLEKRRKRYVLGMDH